MNAIERLVQQNRDLAAHEEPLPAPPSLRVCIVTCMDARIDLYALLGLQRGQAHVLRNAGGLISDDVIRSLVISQHRLGTTEVMVTHHTGCGMLELDERALQAELIEAAEAPLPFSLGGFRDLDAQVRESLHRVRQSPYLLHRDRVRGFVVDIDTGGLREVSGSAPA